MWKALVVGGAVGFFLATSPLPRDALGVLLQLPQAQHKAAIALLLLAMLFVYAALIFAPLARAAELAVARERDGGGGGDVAGSSFRAHLKRRGSLGFLEFLQPVLRRNLLARALRMQQAQSSSEQLLQQQQRQLAAVAAAAADDAAATARGGSPASASAAAAASEQGSGGGSTARSAFAEGAAAAEPLRRGEGDKASAQRRPRQGARRLAAAVAALPPPQQQL